MVSSISRNWFSGLASGMDTQGLIDKLIQLERVPINRIEQKRSTLTLQKNMLQDINLKLFELQNKSTDLLFSATFQSKTVSSSNTNLVTAKATSDAKIGSYNVSIKQLATATKLSSTIQLAGPLALGQNLQSSQTLSGKSLQLGSTGPTTGLGIVPGDIRIDVDGGGSHVLILGGTDTTTLKQTIDSINAQISGIVELNGKINVSYDEKNQQMKVNLLNSENAMTVNDVGAGTIMQTLFSSSAITVDQNNLVRGSTIGAIPSGGNQTMADWRFNAGNISLQIGAAPAQLLDFSGLPTDTTLSDLAEHLNHQIDEKFGYSGNPNDRQLEFRIDASSQKLILANKDLANATGFTLADGTSNLVSQVFGAASLASTNDSGSVLSSANLNTTMTTGSFSVEGVKIQVNTGVDKLQDVLARITANTSVNAFYDSTKNVVTLTRKDGSNNPISLGAPNDTSNFLLVTGLNTGSQAGAAIMESQYAIGAIDPTQPMSGEAFSPAISANGSFRVTVDGKSSVISYDLNESLNEVLDRIKNVEGINEAFFDASTGKIRITTENTGADASLLLEDVSGQWVQAMNLDQGTTQYGSSFGATITGSKQISGIQAYSPLDSSKLLTTVTSGSFTINGVSFNLVNPASTSLNGMLEMISGNAKAGVNATFDAATGSIVLTAKEEGNKTISLGAADDTSNFLAAAGLLSGQETAGTNAVFNIKGVQGDADIVRSTNVITDLVDGVTFTLRGLTSANGENIDVSGDSEKARTAIDDFLEAYNTVTELIYTKLTEKRDHELEALTEEQKSSLSDDEIMNYEAAYQIGLLSGDSTLQSVRSRMRVIAAGVVGSMDSTIKSLSDIGISTGAVGSSYQDTQTGMLKIVDEDKLKTALEDNPDLVAQMFGQTGTSESSTGIARRLKTTLNEFTKTGGILTGRVGRAGLSFANSEFDKQINLLSEQISNGERRLQTKEEALLKQFTDLETAMSRYQSQSSAFTQQLSSLTG
jgi:flagellar hook-associated protein 2